MNTGAWSIVCASEAKGETKGETRSTFDIDHDVQLQAAQSRPIPACRPRSSLRSDIDPLHPPGTADRASLALIVDIAHMSGLSTSIGCDIPSLSIMTIPNDTVLPVSSHFHAVPLTTSV